MKAKKNKTNDTHLIEVNVIFVTAHLYPFVIIFYRTTSSSNLLNKFSEVHLINGLFAGVIIFLMGQTSKLINR